MTLSKNDLLNVCMDPDAFKELVYPIVSEDSLLSPKHYTLICNHVPDALDDEDFMAFFRRHLRLSLKGQLNKLAKRKRRTPVGNEIVDMAFKANRFLSDEDKQQLKEYLLNSLEDFYPYAKKPLTSLLVSWLRQDCNGDDDIARGLLKKHYRTLDSKSVDTILTFIKNPHEDKDIQSVLEKSPEYMLNLFSNLDMNSQDNKKRLLNWLAERPTYMSKINFPLELNAEDFELLPTMRRFGFIKEVYSPLMTVANSGLDTSKGSSYYNKRKPRFNAFDALDNLLKDNGWVKNVKLNWIDEERMKFLVFGASMRNNAETSQWFERYRELCKFRDNFQQKIQTFNRLFG